MTENTEEKDLRPDAEETAAAETAQDNACENFPDAEDAPAEPALSELEKTRKELEETREKLLYLQADYQNYRRRMIKELADMRQMGVTTTLEPFLRVFDYLNMADTAAQKSDNVEAIRQGVAMIIAEYIKVFDDLGVTKVDSVGKPFDPQWHEAVAQEASDTVPEGAIIREWQPAYKMGEKILRAAKVVVSTGKPAPAEEAAEEQ